MKRCRIDKKFTLVEIMVSMGVFLVLLTLLLNFFSGTRQVWKSLRDRNEIFSHARIAMDLMGELFNSGVYANKISGIYINGEAASFVTSSSRTLQKTETAAGTTGMYAVRIYRNSDGHLRIVSSPAGVSSNDTFNYKADKSSVDTSNGSDKLIIRGVSELNFVKLAEPESSINRPMGIEITMKVFDREENYKTWNAMEEGNSKERFRAAHEYVFSRVIAFDDIEEQL